MNYNFCTFFLSTVSICFLLFPSTIHAQSNIEVDGFDNAKVILTTPSWQNPTVLELNAGSSGLGFTEYHLRNQNDSFRIDVKSDFGGMIDDKDILVLNLEGTVETKGGIRPGFTNEMQEGTIRYNPINQALEGYVQGRWKNLNCQSLCITSTLPQGIEEFLSYDVVNAGQVSVNFVFNAPVDPSSVVLESTFQVIDPSGNPIPGLFTWNYNHTRLIFTSNSTNDIISNCTSAGECFTVRMIGTDAGAGSIQSKTGCAFDGDGDGLETGDYEITYMILI